MLCVDVDGVAIYIECALVMAFEFLPVEELGLDDKSLHYICYE